MAAEPIEGLLEAPGRQAYSKTATAAIPFAGGDATAGSEDELQAVVVGSSRVCDLPLSISESRFFRNIARRSASGEAPRRTLIELEKFLNDTRQVWDHSWVRFPEQRLSRRARELFDADLSVMRDGRVGERADASRFRFKQNGEGWIRVPISYGLKLALADLIGHQPHLPELMRNEAERLMKHFLSDNTSPETTSFCIVSAEGQHSLGERVAREAARRFLFTSLLVSWANQRFGLLEDGQRAMLYHAPVPSTHQEELASCVSDSFYRELYMSPCLSGWSDGEAKHQYMHLCHQVLTRSQLNAVGKLRECGIIANNLIVLPALSNVSLGNNGVHISIGSRLLGASGEHPEKEKRTGDLAAKIFEHFLVLFVGTYSAAPFRFGFDQFHPERMLSFMPHELDFTHLRLLWREWKEKAHIRIFGRPLTPYGPRWLDQAIANVFRLRGDCIPDARILTYPVAWLGTEQASALDGMPGNVQRLSSELDQLGIVDQRMSFYMPLRLRERQRDGYSGFEARYYSLFPSYDRDMAPAASLQQFLLALAYRMALSGAITHADIPDDPTSESERRQPFFFAAAGVPAFYVHQESQNLFLRKLLRHCKKIRRSRRHPAYLRISMREYRRGLAAYLKEETCDLAAAMEVQSVLHDLDARCLDEQAHATSRLIHGIAGGGSKAMQMEAREFNRAAEEFYRERLRKQHLREAFVHLRDDVSSLHSLEKGNLGECLRYGVRVHDLRGFVKGAEERLLSDSLSQQEITSLLNLLLLLSCQERRQRPEPA